jgi:type II secretory pathway pseudopilin PulG
MAWRMDHQSCELFQRHQKVAGGFTIVEALIVMAGIMLISAPTYWAFTQMNTFAMSSRLYTTANAVAQNAIDQILSEGPFDPSQNRVPPELAIGTHQPQTAFIYTDPDTGQVVVSGTLTTTIVNANATMTDANGNNAAMNVYKATVTVTYNFRGRDYAVAVDTLRTADQ